MSESGQRIACLSTNVERRRANEPYELEQLRLQLRLRTCKRRTLRHGRTFRTCASSCEHRRAYSSASIERSGKNEPCLCEQLRFPLRRTSRREAIAHADGALQLSNMKHSSEPSVHLIVAPSDNV